MQCMNELAARPGGGAHPHLGGLPGTTPPSFDQSTLTWPVFAHSLLVRKPSKAWSSGSFSLLLWEELFLPIKSCAIMCPALPTS